MEVGGTPSKTTRPLTEVSAKRNVGKKKSTRTMTDKW